MSGRHNIRKGIAALLSVLSVGSIASAAGGPKGLSKSQNLRVSNKGKAPRKNSNRGELNNNRVVNGEKPNLNPVKPSKNVQLNNNMGYREHFKAGVGDLYGKFKEMPSWQQALILGGAIEGVSVLATHKGFVENVFNLTFNRFISVAREKIFKVASEEEFSALYGEQEFSEDMVLSKLGPITSVLAKFSYYLKDSWVDPLVAFVRGLQGLKFEKVRKFPNTFEDKAGGKDVYAINFARFKGLIDKGNWGPAQIKAWWASVSSGFKANNLNMFFYELGWAIHGRKVVQQGGGELTTEPELTIQSNPNLDSPNFNE